MPEHLKTNWKRIGRSGPTVDGRSIEPSALQQVAANYNPETFTAMIWPDHLRFFNMGKVNQLRAESNDEGGIDLFAIIAPNDIYLSINKAGQRLFTSMELMPNFRDSGEFYLTGLAATDEPASAATSEMRFSKTDQQSLLSTFTEHTSQTFDEDHAPGWFKKFVDKFTTTDTNEDHDIMSKQALTELAAKFTALEKKLDDLGKDNTESKNSDDQDKNNGSEDFAALSEQVTQLAEKFALLEKKLTDSAEDKDKKTDVAPYQALADELKALREDFTQAVNEANGTDAGEHKGSTDESSQYI